ncbi:MAG TPA: GntR family transcriptional regulator [Steroidobacteraceae bacterium]|jgi:DNA-binding GntR family transcriptional regulator|nr:GntR family transcriptional regulator [Steroidobacteraceae bacterium]
MVNVSTNTSLTQSVYEILRADLLACRLPPGSKLRINDLSQSLEVSPSAVREALSRLVPEGLVTSEPQRGFRAAPISASDLRALTEIRVDIEGSCLRRSIQLRDPAWEEQVCAALHRLSRTVYREPQDPHRLNEEWVTAHTAFHTALSAGCDNPWRLRVREMLYAQSERYRRLSVPLASAGRDTLKEHTEIADAALAGDDDRAVALLSSHLKNTTRILLEADITESVNRFANPSHLTSPK